MGSLAVLDFEKLCAPIAGPNPAGMDLRSSGRELYDGIRMARNQARTMEKPQMRGDLSAPQGPPEEWSAVFKKAVDALSVHSKDLELTAYLIEATVRLHGFSGLRDGFRLYRELVERFWDNLYPSLDGTDVSVRVAALGGLNGDSSRDGTLMFPIFRLALTDGKSGAFAAYQFDHALLLEKLPPERQQERVDSGQVSLKMFEASAAETSVNFFRDLVDDLRQCNEEFDKLSAVLEVKCGSEQAPSSSRIREALQKCLTIVASVAKDRLTAETTTPAVSLPAASPDSNVQVVMTPGAIRNRKDAFETVEKVAKFFRDTEPQSPVISALEQVVRWGKLPLPELLKELIPDDAARRHLFQLIGIHEAESGS
jgi:type VI secretion system protein ImpA